MTLEYCGKRIKSDIVVSSNTLIYPIGQITARNNKSRLLDQFDVVRVYSIPNKVSKSNLREYHLFFTRNNSIY